jgi:hypothetical protein
MSSRTVGIILTAFGVVVLAYSGISFRTRGKPVEIGPIHVETTRSHFIPPVVGAVALIGGIVLLFVGKKDA